LLESIIEVKERFTADGPHSGFGIDEMQNFGLSRSTHTFLTVVRTHLIHRPGTTVTARKIATIYPRRSSWPAGAAPLEFMLQHVFQY